MIQVGVAADDDGVLSAQLQDDGRQLLRGRRHDLPAHSCGAHEDELAHARGDQRGPGLGEACDDLHEVCWRASGCQGCLDDAAVVTG